MTKPNPLAQMGPPGPAFEPLRALLADHYITPAELGARWRYSQAHLANLRRADKGPPYTQPAGRILYRLSDVIAAELASAAGPLNLERVCLVIAGCDHLSEADRAKTVAVLRSVLG